MVKKGFFLTTQAGKKQYFRRLETDTNKSRHLYKKIKGDNAIALFNQSLTD